MVFLSHHRRRLSVLPLCLLISESTALVALDRIHRPSLGNPSNTVLHASLASRQYTRPGGRDNERTKRQERVGHLVQTELGQILHSGVIRGNVEYLEDELRQRISVVSADVSPDLKQARVSISIRAGTKTNKLDNIVVEEEEEDDDDEDGEDDEEADFDNNPVVDKRRVYSWLVRNTKPIRHTLAQRMSHMKVCPSLSFVQVDVAAATDVMYLIDKVAAGYKRERIGGYNENDMPTGIVGGMDFDEDFDDDDEWDEDENSKFFSKSP